MSLRSHPNVGALSPEIHHPQPIRSAQPGRRVTISADVDQGEHSVELSPTTWRHYVPANLSSTSTTENSERGENKHNTKRSPSAPPAINRSSPISTNVHPILGVRSILRARARMRLAWDVRFSPDAPSPSHRKRYSTSTIHPAPGTTTHNRPRSNTQPQTELELASDLRNRLNDNYHSAVPETGALVNHSLALEPATTPPRSRMLIICRDLLEWLVPIYARDRAVGCTILDVVRGVYNALQAPTENGDQKRIDYLRSKTLFVCLGRDEALTRRRLPSREDLWSEVFVLTLARRDCP